MHINLFFSMQESLDIPKNDTLTQPDRTTMLSLKSDASGSRCMVFAGFKNLTSLSAST